MTRAARIFARVLSSCVPCISLLVVFLFSHGLSAAEDSELSEKAWLENNYTKAEYHIVVRDGVSLYTAVFTPKDAGTNYPIWLVRTPYGACPEGPNVFPSPRGPIKFYARNKFIFALQDVRGRNGSGGEYAQIRPLKSATAGTNEADEATDTWDTIDWLVKNAPNNNGRVGLSGISYPGFYAACGAINSHPALKAVSPQAPVGDWFLGDDYHCNGALCLSRAYNSSLNLMSVTRTLKPPRISYGTQDGYQFFLGLGTLTTADPRSPQGLAGFWDDIVAHGNYDEYWKARDARPRMTNVNCPVLMVGGWFDAEDLYGALTVYQHIGAQNPGARNILVMGPWSHGEWGSGKGSKLGTTSFGSNTSEFFREHVELPFFNHYLKETGDDGLAAAVVFETGVNQWRHFDSWPPKNVAAKTLYFREEGRLAFEPPADSQKAFDEYVSDPARPVPFTDRIVARTPADYVVEDQRFAARRPDVLVYQTEVLKENVTLAGPVVSDLSVSTSGTDSDWIVKLIDVSPGEGKEGAEKFEGSELDGYEQLIRGFPMRGKFRNSFEKPEAFKPGKITKVEWAMPDVFHTFRRGHRIMVQVQSTWFPLFDRNPQTFCDIYKAKPEDFRKATERLYRYAAAPSGLHVGVLPEPN
jgi:putative CocE/NonD family hydrolase